MNAPNVRQGNTVLAHIKLTDGGVAVTWAGFSDIRVDAYSVEQKMLAARCSVERNPQDDTLLDMVYSGDAPQYLGICKIIVRGTYENRKKTYDASLVNFVAATAQATGVIVIDDPEVNVYIEAQDVSTSVIDEAVAAALAAADHAEEAAATANTAAVRADAAREAIQTDLAGKVDKVPGKGLSTNDYTIEDKSKLAGIAAGAQENVIETVKVNGAALTPDANKAVDVPVPTQLSQLDGDVDHRTVSDAEKSTWNGKQDAINDLATIRSRADEGHTAYGWKGNPGGTAELDENGKVLSSQLPSYVDDVLEYPTMSDFPATGESGKIYIAIDTNLSYRWSGSGYSEISPSLALGETASTAYRGDRGKVAYDHATDSNRLTTAKNSGLYKIGVTEQGHVSGATPVEKTDITALGIAAIEDIPTVPAISTDIDADKASNTKTASPKAVYDHVPNLAVNAKTEAKTDQEIVFRKTNVSWPAKAALLKKLKGKTLVWNQLVLISEIGASRSESGITITNNNDGSVTISGTATADVSFRMVNFYDANTSHKYILPPISGESAETYFIQTGYSQNGVFTPENAYCPLDIIVKSGASVNVRYYFQFTDLTLLFNGNVPAGFTAADFEAMFPGYHGYNAGTLISNDAKALETVGFNHWDEEWELGYIDVTATGGDEPSTTRIRSKNYIPVLGNTAYFYMQGQGSVTGRLAYYDANKNFIGGTSDLALNAPFTTPANAAFIRFSPHDSYGVTYNHDICINLSDPARNGQYEPYKKSVLPLNLNSFKVTDGTNEYTVNGLKSAGPVRDEIDLARKKYIKRVGEVDLGDLDFVYNSSPFSQGVSIGPNFNSLLSAKNNNNGVLVVCARYTGASASDAYSYDLDKICTIEDGNVLKIKDSAYSDAAAFIAAMDGVMLDFELATPIEYDLVDPLLQEYTCDMDGTEQAVPPTSATNPSAPLCCDLQYGISSGDTAGELGKLYDLIFALQARVEELENS